MTEQIEKAFHNAIHKLVERYITENEEFELEIIEILGDDDEIPKKVNEFSRLGQISIQLWQENLDVKNLDYTDDDKLKCEHVWETETEGDISATYCCKCMSTKKEIKHLKDIAKNTKLNQFNEPLPTGHRHE